MTRKAPSAQIAVEWSPTHVSWVAIDRSLATAPSLREAAANLPARDVVIAVSRRTAFVRAYRVPNAGKPEVQRILAMQIGSLFPVASDELSFDFHLTQDVNSEGRLAIVTAMRSADLRNIHEQARAAGLRVSRILPVAIGSSALAHSLGLADCAVVHRTAEGLAVDLVSAGELRYSRVAPMPTSAIGMEGEVSRTFAAAVLPCSPTVAAGSLILPDAEVSTQDWSLEALVGTALDIDIKTPEQLRQAARSVDLGRTRLAIILLGGALILTVFQYLRWMDSKAIADVGVRKWQKETTRLKKLNDSQVSKANEAGALRTALDRAFRPAQTFSDLITVASNATPQGVWLTGFTIERGKALVVQGTATKGESVAAFQRALVDEPRFRDVKLLFAHNTEIDNVPVVQFSVSAFPVGNLPLVESTKKGAKK